MQLMVYKNTIIRAWHSSLAATVITLSRTCQDLMWKLHFILQIYVNDLLTMILLTPMTHSTQSLKM